MGGAAAVEKYSSHHHMVAASICWLALTIFHDPISWSVRGDVGSGVPMGVEPIPRTVTASAETC